MAIFLVSQLLGQWSFVIKKLYLRSLYLLRIYFLSLKRSVILFKKSPIIIVYYVVWLCSSFGIRRHLISFFRYYKTMSEFIIRFIVVSCLTVFVVLSVGSQKLPGLIQKVFNFFENPILTEKGYLPYAILLSSMLIWSILIISLLYFRSFRFLVEPYLNKVLLLNFVVFFLLMSLFAKVGRAKFGIRVWYPTNRVYGDRLGFEFWD